MSSLTSGRGRTLADNPNGAKDMEIIQRAPNKVVIEITFTDAASCDRYYNEFVERMAADQGVTLSFAGTVKK
jgi:hypothetical protein